ncbi:hypothetical protein HID58_090877 [Brassica napus]|uniref:Reverse transcriptase zinc-binding domain-containing protein n=1 Tax=Brassica napus TaxID=3708 RepID=A0ABQ7X8U8_BRANA|nr:hypothetical protein HID58_090877 [Brassica napus]
MAGDPYLRPPPHPPCPPTPPVPDPSSFPPLPASPISPPFAPMSFSTHHSPWNLPLVNAPGFGSSALVSGTPITLQLATAEGDSNITHVSTEHAVPTNPVVSSDLGIPAPTLNSSSPLLRITDPFPQSQPQQNTIAGASLNTAAPSIVPAPTAPTSSSSKNPGNQPFKPPPANWAKNLQQSTDISLKKIANPCFSAEEKPRIKIPDSVFQKGADLHQDFIIGVFLGKTPAFAQIQSVLTHIWGRGIPFDLYTQEGLSRVGDLLGFPIEVDEFTRRMVNINVAHIKCKVNCTKPLPRSAEIERDNGEIVTVDIDYPWTPPICPCCNEVGHLETHCPSAKWKPSKNVPAKDKPSKAAPSPAVPVPAAPSPPTDCSLVTPVLPPGPSQTDSMAWEPSVTTSEAQALPTASQEVSPNVVDLSTDSGPSVLPGGPSPSLPPIIPHHPFLPTPFGQLISFIGPQGPRQSGIPLASTVTDLWINGEWSFRHARSPQMEELLIHLTTVRLTDQPSNIQWVMDGAPKLTFSSSAVYNSFFEQSQIVPWHPLIWIKKGIPKHNSLAWLMLLNRSPTRDRLLAWGLQTDSSCLLCNLSNESRNHLYFECPFSSAIWTYYAIRLQIIHTTNSWGDVAHSLLSLTGSKQKIYLSILSWQATVYEVWWERNERLHRGKSRTVDMIWKKINSLIRNKISSLRPESNRRASSLLQLWFSTSDGPH